MEISLMNDWMNRRELIDAQLLRLSAGHSSPAAAAAHVRL